MIQTHYVRLEPPYEVIFCNGEVGIQIGSLIAVEEKRGENDEYGLVTHTHPIVSYGSKKTLSSLNHRETNVLTWPGDFVQGAVWDKAEVNDVLVLGVMNKENPWRLSEKGFAELVFRTLEAKLQQAANPATLIHYLYRNLRLIGIAPSFFEHDKMELKVDIEDYLEVPSVTIRSDDDIIQLVIPISSEENMVNQVCQIMRYYMETLFKIESFTDWTFRLEFGNLNEMTYDDGTPFENYDIPVANMVKHLNLLFSGNK